MSNIYVPPGGPERDGRPRAVGVPPPQQGQYGSVWLSMSCDSLITPKPKVQVVRAAVNLGNWAAPNWQPLYTVCPVDALGGGFDDSSGMFGWGATTCTSAGRRLASLPKGANMLSILPLTLVALETPKPTDDQDVGVDLMIEIYPTGQ